MTDDAAPVQGRSAGHARPRARRVRADPAVPDADRARGRVLHAGRRRDAHQHGSAAPVDPRRAPGRAQARRREGRGPGPGPGLPPPRRREAVRERRLPPGHLLHGPARVRQRAVQRVGAGHGLREAARRRGPAPGRIHPGPLRRAEPRREPRTVHGLDGAGPGRPDADPVVVHRARRDRRHARGADRPADALQLLPHRRRQRRPEPRVHEPPGRLDEPATEQIDNNMALLNENEIFVRRMRGLGTIDTATALRMVMSGPNLRATGVPFDVRRAHPYSVYPELDFDIPTRSEGDCLARYLLRLDEVRQSIRIIDQCLHQMPDGPVMAKLPRLLRPRPGRAYAAVEGPRGQYATYAISDGTDQPFRMRIHDPSFIHLQAVGVMMPGHLLADTMAIMASASTRSWAASINDRHRQVVEPADPARQGHLHGVPLLGRADGRPRRRGHPARRAPRRPGRRESRGRPVPRRRDGDPADHGPDRVPDHLHGDEDHRADEPSSRTGSGGPGRLGAVGGPRPQGPHEGGLHPDRRGPDRVHLGPGRDLPRRRS